MERYCQLGRLLPSDIDIDDAAAMAEAKVVLAEMARTKAEMDVLLGAGRCRVGNREVNGTRRGSQNGCD